MKVNKIAIGSDHAGLEFKNKIIEFLKTKNVFTNDVGTHTKASVHYPDFAKKACELINNHECGKAILVCGTGVGISVAANKINGIRAVVCSEPYSAKMSRSHNDSNVLALGSRVVGIELAQEIITTWLNTEFEGGRHIARLNLIKNLEAD